MELLLCETRAAGAGVVPDTARGHSKQLPSINSYSPLRGARGCPSPITGKETVAELLAHGYIGKGGGYLQLSYLPMVK